jgi:serine-type D-Ala-D-Ala carboxypeptidase (penicillin-binding protein 5/6)
MKKLVVAVLLALVACHNVFAGQTVTSKKIAKPNSSKPVVAKPVQATEPKAPFEAYAVADAGDGKLLEGLNVTQRWPQASLTKLMLAVVVMDKLKRGELHLDAPVIVSKNAEGMGGSQVFLKAGESFTLNELMQAALVESANDAAYAVAEHAAGNVDEFVKLMNRKAQTLGMPDTEYHCVHGLPPSPGVPDNLTTCSDMIRLARAALSYPQILEWTSIEQTTFRNGTLPIHNKNKLVGRLPGVDGLKTGFTRRAGFNIVATGKNSSQRLIVVVLGSPEPRLRDGFVVEKFKEHLQVQPSPHKDLGEKAATGG